MKHYAHLPVPQPSHCSAEMNTRSAKNWLVQTKYLGNYWSKSKSVKKLPKYFFQPYKLNQ